jgi:O-antigen/teichoic acid export membrane protein
VTVPLVVLTPFIIELAFGANFADAAGAARILLVAGVALALARVLEAVLKGANRPLDAGAAEGIGLVFTCIGLAVLLPLAGLEGAAIASLLAYSASAAYATHRAAKAIGVTSLGLLTPRPGSHR